MHKASTPSLEATIDDSIGNTLNTKQVENFPTNTEMETKSEPGKPSTTHEKHDKVSHLKLGINKGKEPTLENLHTPGSLGNSLSWGDQPIPESVDEVDDVQTINYDIKR
jgi:hypothetical protein